MSANAIKVFHVFASDRFRYCLIFIISIVMIYWKSICFNRTGNLESSKLLLLIFCSLLCGKKNELIKLFVRLIVSSKVTEHWVKKLMNRKQLIIKGNSFTFAVCC